VVEHASSPPNPWDGFKACLTDLPDCTHVLTIQDDAMPVPGFADAVQSIAAGEHGGSPVCLWMSAIPSNAAGRARKAYGHSRYISLGPAPFVPLVAVLWPKDTAESFAHWSETAPHMTRADDGNVARWMRQTKQEFLVCVPSIVEHDDWTPTVKGGTRKESHGLAKDRVALLLADDARDYQW
jgi:hypothetical protein